LNISKKILFLAMLQAPGDPLPAEIVRAMMVLRINTPAKGYSWIRLSTIELLMGMLNHNAMESAFTPYKQRIGLIYNVLKPGFAKAKE
jgi:hypothetical protein